MPLLSNATGTLTGASIGSTNTISINGGTGVTVRPGDLIVGLMAQQTNLTASGATDNLGNSYTAQNAGTIGGGAISGRMFYSRVTAGGVLTSVTINATSSANDFSCCAAVFSNGFDSTPIDTNLANVTSDTASVFNPNATGTLAQLNELVIGWSANNSNTTWVGTSTYTIAVQASQTNTHAVICYLDVVVSSTTTPAMSGTNPTANVMGTASFKQTVPMGQMIL